MLSPAIIAKLFFTAEVRIRTYRKLSTMTRHGVGVAAAVRTLQQRYARRSHPLAQVFGGISINLSAGKPLHDALSDFVSAEESMLIGAGVSGARMHESLELCAELLQARLTIMRKVAQSLAYPAFLFALFIVLLVVVAVKVVPSLSTLSPPEQWTGAAWYLHLVSTTITSPAGIVMLCLLLLAFCLSLALLPVWTGRTRVWVEQIPPWSFYRLIQGCTWLFTLAIMQEARIQTQTALDAMLHTRKTSRWLKEKLVAIRTQLTYGKHLGAALTDTGFGFPDPEIVDDLSVYAPLPGFDSRLRIIAQEWLTNGVERIEQQAKILNMVCISGIIAMLCGVALAVGSLQQHLQHSMY